MTDNGGIAAEEIQKCLQDAGYAAQVEVSGTRVVIWSAVVGAKFGIFLYPTDGSRKATSLQFYAAFGVPTPKAKALEAVNDWNREKRFGKAWAEDGRVGLELDVIVSRGHTPDYVKDVIDWWAVIVPQYMTFMQGRME